MNVLAYKLPVIYPKLAHLHLVLSGPTKRHERRPSALRQAVALVDMVHGVFQLEQLPEGDQRAHVVPRVVECLHNDRSVPRCLSADRWVVCGWRR